jgi:hypothetical protein
MTGSWLICLCLAQNSCSQQNIHLFCFVLSFRMHKLYWNVKALFTYLWWDYHTSLSWYSRTCGYIKKWRCLITATQIRCQLGHVLFMVDEVALGWVYCDYFGFPSQFSFHRLHQTHHLSSGAGTVGQLVADVPSGLSLTPPQEIKTTVIVTTGSFQSHFNSFMRRYAMASLNKL